MIPVAFQAAFWGLFCGLALVVGAAAGVRFSVPPRVVALVMAFGAGVLISVLSFELVAGSFERGGLLPTTTGFIVGAVGFTVANLWLARRGARHRKRSGNHQKEEADAVSSDGGLAIALGALLDGVPEAIAIGLGLIESGVVSVATVVAIFLSNLSEGLSSSSGMKRAGRSLRYIFGVGGGITLAMGVAALLGYAAFQHLPVAVIAATTALAAGAILAMIVDTMIPEAFDGAHAAAGLVTSAGFLVAFAFSKLAE